MLKEIRKTDFDAVFKIMEESFPADEHRPYEEQKALLENPLYKIYTFSGEGEEILAFLCVWMFETITYIEHFAVNPSCRNGGIGGKILQEWMHESKKMLCLEVELPTDELTKRRIGFYQRNGFVLNEYPYMQPAISEGRNPIPLLIMTTGRSVSEEEYLSIKRLLYTEVYRFSL